MAEAIQVTSGLAEVDGGQLYYELAGAGRTMVMLHGWLLDSGQWDDQFAALAPRCRVLRYDARGFGRSSQPAGSFAPHEDLLSLMTLLGIDRAVLMGCSGGGATVLDFALAHPDRTEALVLVGSSLPGFQFDGPPPLATMVGLAEYRQALEHGEVDRAVELGLRLWTDGAGRRQDQVRPAARERTRAMMARQLSRPPSGAEVRRLEPAAASRLGELRAPTLAIVGDQDWPVIHAIADLVAARAPVARKLVIADAGHHPNLEHPAQFNELLLGFLDALPPVS